LVVLEWGRKAKIVFIGRISLRADRNYVVLQVEFKNQLVLKTIDMKLVSEDIINDLVDALDNLSDEQYEAKMEAFSEAQPVIFAWLFSEQFDLLTEDEKGFMQYLALIIWCAVDKVGGKSVQSVSEDQIGEAEERNYEVLEQSTEQRFRERLDVFFDNTTQEELLAFAEEAVLEDEDDPQSIVTKEGREPIFVALKTMIDVLTVGE
jgi:hypothetical protein